MLARKNNFNPLESYFPKKNVNQWNVTKKVTKLKGKRRNTTFVCDDWKVQSPD